MSQSQKPGVLHVYDDIEEMDNHLPNWWLGILWGTLLFGLGYWFYYHVTSMGPGPMEAYQNEVSEALRRAASSQPVSDELLVGLSKDPQTAMSGQAVFQSQCVTCHGLQGEGKIGPNLTDGFWLHGSKPVDLYKVVTEGVVAKGMPAWERTLGAERVRAVVAYVLTLEGKNLPGKAPQGEPAP